MTVSSTAQPTRRMTRVPTRTRQLRDIHTAARNAGYDTREESAGRAEYEAELLKVCGRTSSRQALRSEREAIIRHFEGLITAKRSAPVMTQEQFDAEEAELVAMLAGF